MEKPIIISSLITKNILKELESLGVTYIKGGKAKNIQNETAYHPDMLFYPLLNGKILVENKYNDVNKLDTFFKIKEAKRELNNLYPKDCIFNCFTAGKYLICGKSVAEEILYDAVTYGYEPVYVKQGYASCSTVKLPNEAFICSDKGIHNALKTLGFDVLYVNNKEIVLNGYDCGFIGGCVLYVNEEIVAFSGNIKLHSNYNDIKAFCDNYGIRPYSLSRAYLYDYGGFITSVS